MFTLPIRLHLQLSRYLNIGSKRKALLCILLLAGFAVRSQVTVPYRNGEKFGVADAKGKMVVAPQYDWIQVTDQDQPMLIAYTAQPDGSVRTALIDKGKVLLKDQPFNDYYRYGSLFKACSYQLRPSGRGRSREPFTERDAVFASNGSLVLPAAYSHIFIITELDPSGRMNELLISARDSNNRYALYAYDKTQKKITRTFYENSDYFEIIRNYEEVNSKDTSIQFFYAKQGQPQRVQIGRSGKLLKVLVQDNKRFARQEDAYGGAGMGSYGVDAIDPGMPDNYNRKQEVTASAELRKVEIDLRKYYLPRRREQLKISSISAYDRVASIVVKDGKQGLQMNGADTLLIPARYDEILQGEGGFILRSGNKYGLFQFYERGYIVIQPVFDQLPQVLYPDYFGRKSPLIKLYDSNTLQLFGYADGNGKTFYKPE